MPDPADPADPAEPTGDRSVALPVAVLAVVACVVVALLAIAVVVRLDTARTPAGPAREPGVQEPVEGTLAVEAGRAAYEEFRMTLPGAPFRCGTGPAAQAPPGFSAAVLCDSVVHADYDKKGSDWAATNGVGPVDEHYVRDDLDTTAEAVFRSLYDALYFDADHPSLTNSSEGPETDLSIPSTNVYAVTGEVHVKRAGLTTPYDRLVVFVVQLRSGRYVAFFSSFPHDGPTAARDAVQAAARSMSLQ